MGYQIKGFLWDFYMDNQKTHFGRIGRRLRKNIESSTELVSIWKMRFIKS